MHSLVQAAAEFVPELVERSQEIDDNRFLPQSLAERFAAAGFYRACSPEVTGGLNVGPRVACELVETLATGNGSAAWCTFICYTSHLHVASLPAAQRERIAQDPKVIVSSVFAPSGTALRQSRDGHDGYVVNGHWKWGSSSRNAHWISGSLVEVDAQGDVIDGEDAVTRAMFKPQEIQLLDNWHVAGLKGTGSGDYVAQDVWVPIERMGTARGANEFQHEAIFKFPRFGLLSLPIGAITIGMAQASLDEVIALAKQKTPQGSRRTLSQRPVLHRDMAVCQAELRAARALLYNSIDEVWSKTQTLPATIEDRLSLRTANVHAVNAAMSVIDRMFTLVGGSSVFEVSCLQRHFRDVHVAAQHMMVSEPVMELAGRVMMGLDDSAPGL